MFEQIYNVRKFPAIPMGAPFIIIMGLCIMLGTTAPSWRGALVNAGFVIGGLSFAYSWKLAHDLPDMTKGQIAALIAAIAIEIAVFYTFNHALQSLGERGYIIAVLAIVAAHFVIMAPAYGLSALFLAALCGANAATGWRAPGYSVDALWFIDGAIKALVGVTMLFSSPVFHRKTIGQPD